MSLPNRRECFTHELIHNGERYHVTVGFHPDTQHAVEVFADGPKHGSDGYHLVKETCWWASKMMQSGWLPSQLARSVMRDDDGEPYSIKGKIMDLVQTYENKPTRD